MTAGDLITAQQQLEWRGVLFGFPATPLAISNLTGWLDMPPTRSTPVDRPGRHGAFPSQLRASARVVEVEFTLADINDDYTALGRLIDATALGEDDAEEPLVIWAGTDTAQMVMARCEKRAIPTDQDWSVGDHRATVQWVAATNPRRQSVALHTQTIGLPATSVGGLVFPLVFPLDFGSGHGGGRLVAINAGNAPSWPTFTLTGPLTGPIISNQDTGAQLIFDPTFVLTAGQQLVIDTDQRTVTLSGVSRRDRLVTAQWFPLAKTSATNVGFSHVGTYDPAASFRADWRDSWI